MKRNIFLTESQILKIKEDIRALNYQDDIKKTKGSWKEIPIEFNDKLYHDRPDRYKKTSNVNNLVRFYEFEDGSITLSPISKQINIRVNGKWDKMNVWGLGFLSDKAFNQAIKKDSIKKTDSQGNETNIKVNWVNDAKNKLLSYCAQYATKALPYICAKENIRLSSIGYISWPYSSSKFNSDFVTEYLIPALNKEGINISESDIIQNIVVKSRNMKIDYEIAQKIGLDDVDIKALQAFVMAQKQAENLLVIRQRIDNFVRQVQSDINNNNVEQFYQYTRNSEKEEEAKKKDTFNTQGMYLNNVNKDSKDTEWVKQRSNSRMTKVDLTKGKTNTKDKIEDYEIGENFNDIAKKLLAQKELIIKLYDDTKKETENIKNQQEITDDKGRKFNVKDDFGHFEHENNVVGNKERTALGILDDTVDSNGKTQDKSWEIKKFAEAYRQVLYDLFKVNDFNKNMNYDKSKTLIIFDDNVAGGRTLASTCETLLTGEKGVRWEKIIPLTLSFMNITPDTSPTNRSKQDNYRDKIAVQNNMYNDGAKKIIDNNDKSYEIHNFGDIDIWDNPYSNSKKKQQTRQENTPTESKRRGRPRKYNGNTQTTNTSTEPKRRGRPRKYNTNTQTTNIQNITESYIKKIIKETLKKYYNYGK
jgi:hypothetical protein